VAEKVVKEESFLASMIGFRRLEGMRKGLIDGRRSNRWYSLILVSMGMCRLAINKLLLF
jgi:hypothetical protein